MTMENLNGWGRFPRLACRVLRPDSVEEIRAALGEGPVIARGLGRAYGDSALNAAATLDMRRFDRMLAFDPESGQLTAEAGVSLGDIIETFLPRGWFPSVTPGTKHVTLGGMIAADVHGKNHHKHGSLGGFVDWIDLIGPDGIERRCSPDRNETLFRWTLGGMGLTGVILRAALRLTPVESGWIRQKSVACASLEEAIEAFEDSLDWTYSVAWIDCQATGDRLGRSLVMLGEHATREELPAALRTEPFPAARKRRLSVPFDLPGWVLNAATIRLFNELYYRKGAKAAGESFVDWDSYFYPLDAIGDWNRLYGKRGFAQYQCVLPLKNSREGLQTLLRAVAAAGKGSFLAVLKRFGPQQGVFSFPMEGYTLALDFHISEQTLALLDRLDAITVEHGGRLYLAKDSRLSRVRLEQSDNRVAKFRKMREEAGLSQRFSSAQSERLGL